MEHHNPRQVDGGNGGPLEKDDAEESIRTVFFHGFMTKDQKDKAGILMLPPRQSLGCMEEYQAGAGHIFAPTAAYPWKSMTIFGMTVPFG